LYKLVTERMETELEVEFDELVESGQRLVGPSTFDSVQLQSVEQDVDYAAIRFYTCIDVSAVALVDSGGTDVTPPARPNRVPLEVEFVAEGGSGLLLERSEYWPDADYCSR